MNTIENNKLIAEFLSVENPYHKGHYICPNGIATEPKYMRFDSDWNWLMEVIEKIENLETNRFDFQINQWNSRIFDHENTEFIVDLNANSKIESVYNACVEFIKWYNQQKH